MREVIYNPKNENFKGDIKIKLVPYKERLKLTKDLGLKVDKSGQIDLSESDQFGMLEKMYDIAEKYVLEMDVEHIESGEKFSSLEDLGYYLEGNELLSEISGVVMNGVRLGKN